jgi:hypothetical protein
MSTCIYSENNFVVPKVVIDMPENNGISGSLEAISRVDDEVIIVLTVAASEFDIYYFGIKPKKLIIISSGKKTVIEGNIYIKSIEYHDDLCKYRLLIGAKNEKYIRN